MRSSGLAASWYSRHPCQTTAHSHSACNTLAWPIRLLRRAAIRSSARGTLSTQPTTTSVCWTRWTSAGDGHFRPVYSRCQTWSLTHYADLHKSRDSMSTNTVANVLHVETIAWDSTLTPIYLVSIVERRRKSNPK